MSKQYFGTACPKNNAVTVLAVFGDLLTSCHLKSVLPIIESSVVVVAASVAAVVVVVVVVVVAFAVAN